MKIVVSIEEKDWQHKDLELSDIIEIRLDLFSSDFLLHHIQQLPQKPLLFSYRLPKDSSLRVRHPFDKKHEKFLQLCENSKNFIDIELDAENPFLLSFIDSSYQKVFSYHNFDSTLSLEKMILLIKKKENGIFKFAVYPKNFDEVIDFLENIKILSQRYKIIGVCMGEIGYISRIYGNFFGSIWSYACVGKEKAPGQLNINQILRMRKQIL